MHWLFADAHAIDIGITQRHKDVIQIMLVVEGLGMWRHLHRINAHIVVVEHQMMVLFLTDGNDGGRSLRVRGERKKTRHNHCNYISSHARSSYLKTHKRFCTRKSA